jgi:hypothetical protein
MPLRGASMPPSLEDFHRRVMRAAGAATAGGRLASTIELSYKAARSMVAAVHRAAGCGAKNSVRLRQLNNCRVLQYPRAVRGLAMTLQSR